MVKKKKKSQKPVSSGILLPLVNIGIAPVVAGDFPTTLRHKTWFSVRSQKAGSFPHRGGVLHGIASVKGLWGAPA